MDEGIVVGCDQKLEWILPWWWNHYSAHNSYPVAFVDFGMSKKAATWCQKRGRTVQLPKSTLLVPSDFKEEWAERYGIEISAHREAWFKKPLAFLLSPFSHGLWIDLDCEIRGSVEPLFHCLTFGAEIALAREPDFSQKKDSEMGLLLPDEISYNSGVIAFKQQAKILQQWIEEGADYPSDQQALSRAIFNHKPNLVELPHIYNWVRVLGPNEQAVIYHYAGNPGKIEILEQLEMEVGFKSNALKP